MGLQVNAVNANYVVMSWDQNAGKNHSENIANKSFKRVEQFRYLEKTLTNQNCILEEIKSTLKPWNYLLLFGAESFVFQFHNQKYKD
jgi:hypothetical protein